MFQDRNFVAASIVIAALGLSMYGAMVIQPIMLEGLFHYPTLDTGLIMAPRGIASLVSMMIVGKLIGRVDSRYLIGTGLLIGACGTWVCTHYNLDTSPFWFAWPVLLQGFGLGMIYVPLSAMAMSTLPARLSAEAAGLFSLLRTMGSSVGIAIVSTAYRAASSRPGMPGGFFSADNPWLQDYLARMGKTVVDGTTATQLAAELQRQALMVSIVDVYWLITYSFLAMLPLLLLLRPRGSAGRCASRRRGDARIAASERAKKTATRGLPFFACTEAMITCSGAARWSPAAGPEPWGWRPRCRRIPSIPARRSGR
jgi:DHA2 family multidrug resistance protein